MLSAFEVLFLAQNAVQQSIHYFAGVHTVQKGFQNVLGQGILTLEDFQRFLLGFAVSLAVQLHQLLLRRGDLYGRFGSGRGGGRGGLGVIGCIQQGRLSDADGFCNLLQLLLSQILFAPLPFTDVRGGDTGDLPGQLFLSQSCFRPGFLDEGAYLFCCHNMTSRAFHYRSFIYIFIKLRALVSIR